MSRFDTTRWGKILAWSGAALTWGAALTAARLEPARAEPPPAQPEPVAQTATAVAPSVPTQPATGLVILRYQPSEKPAPEVTTVYVRPKTSAPPAAKAKPAPAPAPAKPAPAPAPRSSGS